MDFFQSVRDFYEQNLFTDLTISVSRLDRTLQTVCKCHRLVFAAAFPAFTQDLNIQDESHLIFENCDGDEIKKAIDGIYDALVSGDKPTFSQDFLQDWTKQQKECFFSLQQIVDLIQSENYNDSDKIIQPTFNEVAFVQNQDHVWQNEPSICIALAMTSSPAAQSDQNNESLQAQVLSVIYDSKLLWTASKVCGKFTDLIRHCFDCETDDILLYLGDPNNEWTKKLQFDFSNAPVNKKKSAKIQLTESLKKDLIGGYYVLSGKDMNSLSLQPLYNGSDDNSFASFIKAWLSFCCIKTVDELKEVLFIKSLLLTKSDFPLKRDLQRKTPMKIKKEMSSDAEEYETDNFYDDELVKDDDYRPPPRQKKFKRSQASHHPIVGVKKVKREPDEERKGHVSSDYRVVIEKRPRRHPAIYVCNIEDCRKKFKFSGAYENHQKVYHSKVAVPCEKCGKMYRNAHFLKRHKRQAHDELKCKDCRAMFIGMNELTRHVLKEHRTGNEIICELCGMGFKLKSYLKRHLRQQHPGSVKSPFICEECDKPFGTGRKYQDHMNAFHWKIRPHKCRAGDHICDKAFTTINMRRRHERQVHKLFIYTPAGSKSKFVVDPTDVSSSNADRE